MTKKVFGQTAKWAESIRGQLEDVAQREINAQYINLNQIVFDPENSRSITLTMDDIHNGPKLPQGDYDATTQDAFIVCVEEFFKDDPKCKDKIEEYLSLARLAASIKTPENLINPITGYMSGMNFQLIAGHRRTLAHYILGCKHISAKLLAQPPSPLEFSVLQWSENEDRESLSIKDQLKSVSKIINAWEFENKKPVSVSTLTTLISTKKTKSAWFLKLCKNTDKDITSLINQGVITSLELGYKVASLKSKSDKDQAIQDLQNGKIKSPKDITLSAVRPPNSNIGDAINPNAIEQEILRFYRSEINLITLAIELAENSGMSALLKTKQDKDKWQNIVSRALQKEGVLND